MFSVVAVLGASIWRNVVLQKQYNELRDQRQSWQTASRELQKTLQTDWVLIERNQRTSRDMQLLFRMICSGFRGAVAGTCSMVQATVTERLDKMDSDVARAKASRPDLDKLLAGAGLLFLP